MLPAVANLASESITFRSAVATSDLPDQAIMGGEAMNLATHAELRLFELAAAAGRAAAFADIAAARWAHLGTAGEAERRVGGAALVRLEEPGRIVRLRRVVSRPG
jgi:hypothetical protein